MQLYPWIGKNIQQKRGKTWKQKMKQTKQLCVYKVSYSGYVKMDCIVFMNLLL